MGHKAGFQDIHRFEKHTCRWKHLKNNEDCAYSSRVCRALNPQQTLALCKQNGCKHRLSLMECVELAVAYGTASSLKWLLDHKAELMDPLNDSAGSDTDCAQDPSSDEAERDGSESDVSKSDVSDQEMSFQLYCLRSDALERGNTEVLQVLDEAGLLEYIAGACGYNQLQVAEWLLAHGRDLPLEYGLGWAGRGSPEVLLWLRERGIAVDYETFAMAAVCDGKLQDLQRVYSMNPQAWKPHVLGEWMRAASNADVIKWLHTDLGAPLQASCCSVAAQEGDLEFLEWLRERDAPFEHHAVACCAARSGHLHLVKHIDSINPEPWTADKWHELLLAAIASGDVETCDWILNRLDSEERTEDWAFYGREGTPLRTVQWALEHGVTLYELARYECSDEVDCAMLKDTLCCEAFHWAHENGWVCSCPNDSEYHKYFDIHERPSSDAFFKRRL